MRTLAFLTWLLGINVAVAPLCSAAAIGVDQPESAEYTGCIIWGHQERVFRPKPFDGPEEWAVVSVPDDFEPMLKGLPAPWGRHTVFVRVHGSLGPAGHYGHAGMARRQLKIHFILELRQFEESDGTCGVPAPPVPPPEANKRLQPTLAKLRVVEARRWARKQNVRRCS